MTAQTPISVIVVDQFSVFTEDWAGNKELQATCPSTDQAQWVGWSLARAHATSLRLIEQSTPKRMVVTESAPLIGPEPNRRPEDASEDEFVHEVEKAIDEEPESPVLLDVPDLAPEHPDGDYERPDYDLPK
jgi:hypothetical protein